jgi:hypothetical protein
MKFPYVRHNVDASPAIPSGEIARPEVPIRIIGPNGAVEIVGLLDTGADHVFLSVLLAELLGIEIDDEPAETAEGAGGHELKIWPAEVEIEILSDGRRHRWRAHVGFIESGDDPAAAYLGHVGFLEFFSANFDYRRETVELVANDSDSNRVK